MAAYSQGTVNFITALACIQLESGLRPDQVALGLPAVAERAPAAAIVAPSVVNNALDCLADAAPTAAASCRRAPTRRSAAR